MKKTLTLRGIHFQRPPNVQAKLVRCVRGRIFVIAIDLQHSAPTFGRSVSAVLTVDGDEQMFVPVGFGHGYFNLEAACEVAYKVVPYHAPEADGGTAWYGRQLAIAWPLDPNRPLLSAMVAALPMRKVGGFDFAYDGCPLNSMSKEI